MGLSMKIVRRNKIVLAIIFLFILGCLFGYQMLASQTQYDMKNITVTNSDNGSSVQIISGGILTLKLGVRPATGYAWKVSSESFNPLKLIGESTFEETTRGKPGVSEYQVFRFRAQKHGTSTLKLPYVREWEKNVKPVSTFSVTVDID